MVTKLPPIKYHEVPPDIQHSKSVTLNKKFCSSYEETINKFRQDSTLGFCVNSDEPWGSIRDIIVIVE